MDSTARLEEIEEHRQMLTRFIQSRVRNRTDAEDIVQTVMLRGLSKIEDFRGDCPLSHWLVRIAANQLKLYYSRTLPKESRQTYLDEVVDEPSNRNQDADDENRCTVSRLLLAAKESCNKDEVRILLMVYRGESFEEIAKLLNMSSATVRSHFMRGRANLLSHLVQHDPMMLGGESAISTGARLAMEAVDPSHRLTSEEVDALANPGKRVKSFRSACLKLARFLPLPLILIALEAFR